MLQRSQTLIDELARVDGFVPGRAHDKHKKMCTSPFVFFRGSASLFYADLASKALSLPDLTNIPLTTIMGDCHTSNFGFFTEEGSFTERVVFSINDFDDACVGYGMWDLMRLLVSLPLVKAHCKGMVEGFILSDKNLSDAVCVTDVHVKAAMVSVIDNYIGMLEKVLSENTDRESVLGASFEDFATPSALKKRRKKASKVALGGDKFLQKSALAKAVDVSTFPLRFKHDPTKFMEIDEKEKVRLTAQISPYFVNNIFDLVGRVGAGTGSVNLNRYYALVSPKQIKDVEDLGLCHVVEIKQQREAAPIFHFPNLHVQNTLNPAHLTVKCQNRMQHQADYILDHAYFDNKYWLIRSRHHSKVGIDPEHIGLGEVNVLQGGLSFYAGACAQELARSHCRGDRFSLEYERASLEYLRIHHDTLIERAFAHSELVLDDWRRLQKMV